MLRHIEELRKKPKAVRNQYAFSIALSVTLLIVAVWAISLPARLTFEEVVVVEEPEAGPSFGSQLSELNSFFGEGIEEIKTQAEAIGAALPEADATVSDTDANPVIEPSTDTAHYDFFAAPAESGQKNVPNQEGEQNQ